MQPMDQCWCYAKAPRGVQHPPPLPQKKNGTSVFLQTPAALGLGCASLRIFNPSPQDVLDPFVKQLRTLGKPREACSPISE